MDGHRNVWRCRPAYVVIACIATVSPLAAACSSGPERSVESFCSTMRSEKARILDQLKDAQNATAAGNDQLASVLLGLGGSIQAIGELRTYFAKLSAVAPEEIRVEVEIVADAVNKQLDAAGDAASNPLGSLGSALVTSITTSGQLNAVNEFAKSNCGEGI